MTYDTSIHMIHVAYDICPICAPLKPLPPDPLLPPHAAGRRPGLAGRVTSPGGHRVMSTPCDWS